MESVHSISNRPVPDVAKIQAFCSTTAAGDDFEVLSTDTTTGTENHGIAGSGNFVSELDPEDSKSCRRVKFHFDAMEGPGSRIQMLSVKGFENFIGAAPPAPAPPPPPRK